MRDWSKVADDVALKNAVKSLADNGISAEVVETADEARKKALELIPKGSEVMTMTSVTLDTLGLTKEFNESGKYDAVKPKMSKMNRKTQGLEMQKMGAAPQYSIASVHALTEEGQVFIASNTGSQIPGSAYGSPNVIWVIGGQKIVKDREEALKRVYDYVLPLESERARIAYGVSGSNVSKLLIINKEVNPNRIKVIIVKEALGF
ncbi:LUD domain-containing protein [Candidatus Daviesbacteria bacterium]|nr:LUD domain-containing protein [Candidatus Daviesbacteria bacterium]